MAAVRRRASSPSRHSLSLSHSLSRFAFSSPLLTPPSLSSLSLSLSSLSSHRRVRKAQERLIVATQDNTAILKDIGSLSREQSSLEEEMNPDNAEGDDDFERMKQQREQDRLIAVVKLQARQVDALKAEIAMLRTKGGHVYTGSKV